MTKTKIEVIPETVTKEVLATTIRRLSDAANELLSSGLNERAIVVLLSDSTKVSKGTVKKVLGAMTQLREDYTYN